MTVHEAKTFTVLFDAREDRLRLVLNYEQPQERFDYWITRSFLLKLLPVLSNFNPHSKQESIKTLPISSQPSSVASTDNITLELTQKDPYILDQIHFHILENQQIRIDFDPHPGPRYVAILSGEEINAIRNLLIQTAPSLEWGIGPWWR